MRTRRTGGDEMHGLELFHSSTWNVPRRKLDVPRRPCSRYLPPLAQLARLLRCRSLAGVSRAQR